MYHPVIKNLDMDMMSTAIQSHPEYPDVMNAIEKFAHYSKGMLIIAVHDESGESHTRTDLRRMSRGKLLAMLVDQQIEA